MLLDLALQAAQHANLPSVLETGRFVFKQHEEEHNVDNGLNCVSSPNEKTPPQSTAFCGF